MWGRKQIANGKRVAEFTAEYGRTGEVVASEDVKNNIRKIGVNKCARESGFDRKNFIRKLVRGVPVKRNPTRNSCVGSMVTNPKAG